VQNVEPDTEIGQKGAFCKGLRLIAQATKLYKDGDDHDYDKAYTSKHWNYAG